MAAKKSAEKPATKTQMPTGEIIFGSRVTLLDLDANDEEVYELVGPGEENYTGEIMKILCNSPLGKQLLHHEVGDTIAVDTPGGTVNYEVKKIE